MIGQNYKYKGFDFSDILAKNQRVLLSKINHKVETNTNIYNRANYHGTYSSKTIARGRLITFKGKIFSSNAAIREQKRDLLNSIIQVQSNLAQSEFYKLEWETKGGSKRRVMAKVFTIPDPENGLNDPEINFTFELYAENHWYFGDTDNVANGYLGMFGGTLLPASTPITFSNYTNLIEVVNNGNWAAPCMITINGNTNTPQIVNLTNGSKISISGITNNLVIDGRNLLNNPSTAFTITDDGNDISTRRQRGGPIMLSPGVNYISVSDYYMISTVTVAINRYDTYT